MPIPILWQGHAQRGEVNQIIAAGQAIGLKSSGSNRFVRDFDVQREQHSTKRDENQWLRKWETMIVNTFNEHNYAVKLQCNQESKLKLTPKEADCITLLCGMNFPLITIHLEHYEVKWFRVPKDIEGTRRSNTKPKGEKNTHKTDILSMVYNIDRLCCKPFRRDFR